LRAACHYFVQQLPQSPLPQVSDGCPGPLDRRASEGTSPDALRPRSLYTSRTVGIFGATEQSMACCSAPAPRHFLRSRGIPDTSARKLVSSASRRWVAPRSHSLDKITLAI